MTVSSQICKRVYQADGENRRWAIDFPYLSAAQLKVYCTDTNGVETDISNDCVLDEIEQEIIYPTLPSEQDPLPTGYTLTIVRTTTPTQLVHLTQQGVLDAVEIEKGLDKLTLQIQELGEQVKRSVKYPISSNKTGEDAQALLAEIQTVQTNRLNTALAQVQAIKDSLAQTVLDEATARQGADNELQNAVQGKQEALTMPQLAAVNSGITLDKTNQIQSNQENIAALDEELDENRPWQKPSDWVDIRSGALPNSVYVLVGHSADYSLYPKFSVRAEISNSGSYDVYIDGVKYATTANNTETNIDWETLALQTGRSTTYPISLVTHIVRVTPTSSSETISYITFRKATTDTGNKALGVLWAHFNISNAIKINQNLFQYNGSYNPYLVAVTAQNDLLKNSGGVIGGLISETSDYSQYSSQYIQHLPKFEATANADVNFGHRGTEYTNITKLILSGDKNYRLVNYSFDSCYQLKEIQVPSMTIQSNGSARFAFRKSYALKKLPSINFTTATNLQDFLTEAYSLEPTFLDLTSATLLTKLGIYGTSENRIDGLKGLVVSNSAPFSNATSPQINISYTGLNRQALIALFNSLPTVTNSQVCNITGAIGAADLTASDLSIATGKGWTVTR